MFDHFSGFLQSFLWENFQSFQKFSTQKPKINSSNLPKLANKTDVMKLSIEIETTSPIEAASGVAKLSGLTLYLFESRITATSTKSD